MFLMALEIREAIRPPWGVMKVAVVMASSGPYSTVRVSLVASQMMSSYKKVCSSFYTLRVTS